MPWYFNLKCLCVCICMCAYGHVGTFLVEHINRKILGGYLITRYYFWQNLENPLSTLNNLLQPLMLKTPLLVIHCFGSSVFVIPLREVIHQTLSVYELVCQKCLVWRRWIVCKGTGLPEDRNGATMEGWRVGWERTQKGGMKALAPTVSSGGPLHNAHGMQTWN